MMKISKEILKNLDEMAEIVYSEDKLRCKFAKEGIREDGDLTVMFDNYEHFEKIKRSIEEKCWARGLILVQEGECYVIKPEE